MSTDTTKTTAEKLVAGCRENRTAEGLDTLYDADVVSVEAMTMPGADSPEMRGLAALKGKHEWWNSSMELHSGNVDGPFPHGDDRFAVIFEFDATEKATGKRSQMKEVGIYTVNDAGKIVREEFFYTT